MGYLDDIVASYKSNSDSLVPDFKGDITLRLELTNYCNHNCQFCVNSQLTRKRIHMEEDLIYRIIRAASQLGIKRAGLFMNGEPFASARLDEYIAFAKSVGMEYVFITTNGALATKEKLKNVFDAGLDSIKFSINGGTQASYEKVHGKDDFDKVISNLKFSYWYREEQKLNYKILTSYAVTIDNCNEIDKHYDNISQYVDDIVFFRITNYGGQAVDKKLQIGTDFYNSRVDSFKSKYKLPCPMLFNQVNVTCEGYLTMCCSEAMNKMVVEDLHEKSLKDAWHSEKMIYMRKRHLDGKVEGTQCFNCINDMKSEVSPMNEKLYFECQK